MTHNIPGAAWGESTRTGGNWWSALLTMPALLVHITLMFTAVSVLTLLNLSLNPGTWWSLAVLVLWFALVIIHALGVVSGRLLLDDEADQSGGIPRMNAEPQESPQESPYGTRQHEPAPPLPDEWTARPDTGQAADSGTPATSWPASPASPGATPDDQSTPAADEPDHSERVPWRAATDIAWLRRRNERHGEDAAPGSDDSARNKDTSS